MKYIYLFDEGKSNMHKLLGDKGVKLSEMINLGLPVPQGFIITTEACNQYYKDKQTVNFEIQKQINEYISKLEKITGKKFGDKDNPLLLSTRVGANVPIPKNTILNIGLNDEIVENLSKNINDFRWIWECYLNLIKNYSKFVMDIDLEYFEHIKNNNLPLTIDDFRLIVDELKKEYKLKVKNDFPNDSMEQLMTIINAYFKSWNNDKANIYRKDLDIPFTYGMAIYIQSMVFGNINKNCGVGTIFTRNNITGKKELIDKFSRKSQEVVDIWPQTAELSSEFPEIYYQLKKICELLEYYYKDMQKIDFVIEENKLFIIQTSHGKRTINAALKIACDLVGEGIKTNNFEEKTELVKLTGVDLPKDMIGPYTKKLKNLNIFKPF